MADEKKEASPWPRALADVVAVVAIGAMVGFGKLDGPYALAAILLIIGANLPSKGGGVATMLLPFLQLFRNGNGRFLG